MWPRGKYNGKKIAGFSIEFKVNVFHWTWKPMFLVRFSHITFHWLCFSIFFEPVYDEEER